VTAGLVKSPEDWKNSYNAVWTSAEQISPNASIRIRNGLEYRRFVLDFAEARGKEDKIEDYLFGE